MPTHPASSVQVPRSSEQRGPDDMKGILLITLGFVCFGATDAMAMPNTDAEHRCHAKQYQTQRHPPSLTLFTNHLAASTQSSKKPAKLGLPFLIVFFENETTQRISTTEPKS